MSSDGLNGVSNGGSHDVKDSFGVNGHKIAQAQTYSNSHTNGYTNGAVKSQTNGHANGHTNGYTNGHTNGHANGNTREQRNENIEGDIGTPATVPIAVVGMSCRFSGGATNPEKLWDVLAEGRSCWSPIPASRFDQDAFYHPHAGKLGTSHVKGGHFLQEDVSLFDPHFFGFPADVAASKDPQVRILLELVYEALESAGISMSQIAGTNTSSFAGTFIRDYHDLLMRDPVTLPRHFMTGNFTAMIANRISHFFDLRGPSTPVDTGCSTSLTALHLACQTLRSGESDCSIVGGACVMTNPDMFCQLSSLGIIGPDGKCYAFDHRAQGYGRGEGVAALVLKRLDLAIKDKDPIRAIIRETGMNQDGKTLTITSPSGEAQEALMRSCYQKAGLNPHDTTYVEAHGTGTKTGDPIEATAIGSVFGQPSPSEQPLFIGSLKSNIGHTEAASGLAAIIKVAMALEKGLIPPSINYEKPNPEIDFPRLGLQVTRKLESWPACDVRRASINNFGYSGTNTHVIMEEANQYQPKPSAEDSKSHLRKIFVLSAKDEKTANAMVSNLKDHLLQGVENGKKIGFADLAYTLGQRRSKLPWSTAISAATIPELAKTLGSNEFKPSNPSNVPRLGFVFNGQGAQWFAMGRELMRAYPVYRETLIEADSVIKDLGSPWSIIEELSRPSDQTRVNNVAFSFPLSCVVQLALVRLLASWGISPTAVTGHSSGEVAAAFAAGALTLTEAMVVTYFRGLLTAQHVQTTTVQGGMLAVGLGADDASAYLDDKLPGKVVIACINSPASVTLSGDIQAIDALTTIFTEKKIFAKKLIVESAYHSHHMFPIAEVYHNALSSYLAPHGTLDKVKFSSPVSGTWISDAEELGAAHWVENMTKPVLFSQSLSTMLCDIPDGSDAKQNVDMIIEIGPHGALSGPIRQITTSPDLEHVRVGYGSCLTRGKDAVQTIQELASTLLRRGVPVALEKVNFPLGCYHCHTIHDLPSYPWNHSTKFWAEPRASREHRFRKNAWHDLLGIRVPGTTPFAPVWRHFIKAEDVPWVRDHQVQSDIVYPAAGCISMAIEAARQLSLDNGKAVTGYSLRDIQISRALVVPDSTDGIEVQLVFTVPDSKALVDDWREFHIYSAPNAGDWVENCSGLILASNEAFALNLVPSMGDATYENVEPSTFFDNLHRVGVCHGPAFQNLLSIQGSSGSNNIGKTLFKISDVASMMPVKYQCPHVIHPITLDAVFQAAYPALNKAGQAQIGAAIPRSIDSLYISEDILRDPESALLATSKLMSVDDQGFNVRVSVAPPDHPAAQLEIGAMRFQSLGLSAQEAEEIQPELCMKLEWEQSLDFGRQDEIVERLRCPVDDNEKVVGEDLTRATYHLAHDTLAELTEEDIANLDSHHVAWLNWMRQIEEQAANNKLSPKSSRWQKAAEGVKQMLFDRVSSQSVNGELLVRLGRQIPQIMRKQVAALDIMMEGKLLSKFHRERIHSSKSIVQAVELLKVYARQNMHANILEIGAGKGSCTEPVLHALTESESNSRARLAHYEFTDVSPESLEEARKNFAAWGDLISYSTLDIEKDPEEQSFKVGSYDLVIASLVLSETKDITNTLKNVRSLLKPGGKLLLVETTQDTIDVNMIFGSLPSWWHSQEAERKHSPNLTLDMWQDTLSRTGFSGLDLDVWDCEDEAHRSMSAIMTTAVSISAKELPKHVSLVYSGSKPDFEWLRALQGLFISRTGILPSVESLEELNATEKVCIYISEIETPVLSVLGEAEFGPLKAMVENCRGLLWVTRGAAIDCVHPDLALHAGLLRVRRIEDAGKKYVSLDLDPEQAALTANSRAMIYEVFAKSFEKCLAASDIECEYALRGSKVMVPRVSFDAKETEETLNLDNRPAELQPLEQPHRELRMYVEKPGSLDTIVFKTDPEGGQPLPSDYVEVEGKAFGLNFRDIMVAMGQLKEKNMGFECGGIITRVGTDVSEFQVGDRVSALTVHGHWASRSRIPATSVARIPDSMDFETAASIPMVFLTAYYSLFEAGRLEKGDTVLIHAASGGVGQAAIALAQHRGAEVFATVSTQEKRDFLKTTYGLADDHIFSSRSTAFAVQVKLATGGRGVDLVLNSLAGKLLNESWECLTHCGRFIEIGKRDIQQNKRLEMEPFGKGISFIAFDLIHLTDFKPKVVSRMFKEILTLLENGNIKTISPVTVLPVSDLVRAFRTMQAGKHMGKIVVRFTGSDLVPTIPYQKATTLASDATYLIVGGTGGIGRSLANWFVEHGAKNLILLSRTAAGRPESAELVEKLESRGCRVLVKNCNVADLSNLAAVVEECAATLPPVKGIVQGAMVLQDSIWERMTYAQWQAAISPKVAASHNLHRHFGATLDFFIMLSSVVAIIGNLGQANYAAGGAFQDALARHRSARNLPAVSINLGMVNSVGYVAENKQVADRLLAEGYRALDESEVLDLVAAAIRTPQRTLDTSQVITGLLPIYDTEPNSSAGWRAEPRFRAMRRTAHASGHEGAMDGAGRGSSTISLPEQIARAETDAQATEVVLSVIKAKLAVMFVLSETDINVDLPLSTYGLDSLVAVELRNWLVATARCEVSIFDILGSGSLTELAQRVVGRCKGASG